MLKTKKYFYSALDNSTELTTALGDGEITDEYPETIEVFPMVIYVDENQSDGEYADNKPLVSKARVTVHIFTKALTGYPTTTTLGVIIANIFDGLFFNCVSNGEVADDTEGVRHRVMKFSRELFPGEV